ncbi:E3 ubiquitin-protein ligase RNF31 [Hypsibius exemplaris]|uniref:E3 ubiquitin-protein ligase RNF31 n=1 Tax=Hypsibius exemplaris TaxID=2072580 RepID=A0A1W0WWA6_HYPEX|nr:E3 ubiquitin-protein ligase RNF31 [Hypsibius exemplaris]
MAHVKKLSCPEVGKFAASSPRTPASGIRGSVEVKRQLCNMEQPGSYQSGPRIRGGRPSWNPRGHYVNQRYNGPQHQLPPPPRIPYRLPLDASSRYDEPENLPTQFIPVVVDVPGQGPVVRMRPFLPSNYNLLLQPAIQHQQLHFPSPHAIQAGVSPAAAAKAPVVPSVLPPPNNGGTVRPQESPLLFGQNSTQAISTVLTQDKSDHQAALPEVDDSKIGLLDEAQRLRRAKQSADAKANSANSKTELAGLWRKTAPDPPVTQEDGQYDSAAVKENELPKISPPVQKLAAPIETRVKAVVQPVKAIPSVRAPVQPQLSWRSPIQPNNRSPEVLAAVALQNKAISHALLSAQPQAIMGTHIAQPHAKKVTRTPSEQTTPKVPVKRISKFECRLCLESFPITDIIPMLACEHTACIGCTRRYFANEIQEKAMSIITCHSCKKPDFNVAVPGYDVGDYLGHLDQLLRTILNAKDFELYDRKLLNLTLSMDPDFKWCGHCPSGYLTAETHQPYQECPDCHVIACKDCNIKWNPDHKGRTCEEVVEERALNAQLAIEAEVEKHLKRCGIRCPKCNFQFELAKGGCLHFRCLQCRADFCGGCRRDFSSGARCKQSPNCANMGLHGHHPRNCPHYTRDIELARLEELLTLSGIRFKLDALAPGRSCVVMEQQQNGGDLKDALCARQRHRGVHFCHLHYTEYLCELIFNNNIDPLMVYTDQELEQETVKHRLARPAASSNYRVQLIDLIRKTVPLDKVI